MAGGGASMKALKRIVLLCCALGFGSRALGLDKAVYDFNVKTIKGDVVSMKQYVGKVLLLVNTASGCGFTPQFKGLQELYKTHKAQGFAVLGFPSNDFGGQEPKSNKEIKDFCELNYKVDFPLFSKVTVSGPGKMPLFRYLTETAGPEFKREIDWNFEKFLINRKGQLVARFKSSVEPTSKEITERVEMLLKEKGTKG
jgi:glutathione peroxidase